MYAGHDYAVPISPSFATAEPLARWLAAAGASGFGRATCTYDEWLDIINGDDVWITLASQ